MVDRAYLERMSRDLANKGQLIGAGWVGYRLMVVPSGIYRSVMDGSEVTLRKRVKP